LLGTLGSVALTTVAWIGLVNARPKMGVGEAYGYLAALIGVLGAGWYTTRRRAIRRGVDPGAGIVALWVVLCLVVGLALPALGYLFAVPALATAIAVLLPPREAGYRLHLTRTALVAIVAFVIMTPAVDTFFQLAGPRPGNPSSELPEVIAVAMLLAFLTIGLVASIAAKSAPDPAPGNSSTVRS
jgi:hypothetical protein